MLSNQFEVISYIIREAEPVCAVSENPNESKSFAQVHNAVEMAAEGVSTTAEVAELCQVVGPRVGGVASKAGLFLGFIPLLMDIGKKINSQFNKPLEDYLDLPPVLPLSSKKHHKQAYAKIQRNMIVLRAQLSELKPSQRDAVQKLLIGLPSNTSVRPSGLLGLKHVAEFLRHLPAAKKEVLVNTFTRACEQYQHSLQTNQLESSLYLTLALTPFTEQGKIQAFFTDHTAKHGITAKMQRFLHDSNFPQSISSTQLQEADFLAICDPAELKKEAYQAAKRILANPGAYGITRTDIILEGDEVKGFILKLTKPLDSQLKNKIFEQINVRNVIKSEVFALTEFLKKQRNLENKAHEINLKMERIIHFLHETDCNDELGEMLDTLIKMIEPEIATELHQFYQDSLHPAYNRLSNHIMVLDQQSEDVEQCSVDDTPGISYSTTPPVVCATEESIALLNPKAAILFYNRYLNSDAEILKFTEHFKKELDNLDTDFCNPTQCISLATIIRLMTVIHARKHPMKAQAYMQVFNTMKSDFMDKIKEIKEDNLRSVMELSLEIIQNLMEMNYHEYAARLEDENSTKETISSTVRNVGRGADVTSLLVPATDLVAVPLSLACAGTASLIDMTKDTPDILRQGEARSDKEIKALQATLMSLKNRDAQITAQALKNMDQLLPGQHESIQAIHRYMQVTMQILERGVATLRTAQQTFVSQMANNPDNPLALLSQLEGEIVNTLKEAKEAEQKMSQNIRPEVEKLNKSLEPTLTQLKMSVS